MYMHTYNNGIAQCRTLLIAVRVCIAREEKHMQDGNRKTR